MVFCYFKVSQGERKYMILKCLKKIYKNQNVFDMHQMRR